MKDVQLAFVIFLCVSFLAASFYAILDAIRRGGFDHLFDK